MYNIINKKHKGGKTMDYSSTAKQIVAQIGGEKNVVSVTHCMTRLRFVLKDETGVDDKGARNNPRMVL